MAKKNPTIKEVAQHAGVSLGTASNVLHGKETLHSPETTQRVWDSARALGYRPNQLARSLVQKRTSTIGVVAERHQAMLTRNLYFSHVLDGILEYVVPREYQVKLISLLNDSPQNPLTHIENGTIDGAILVTPAFNSPLLEWAQQTRLPLVVIGSALPDKFHLTYVDVDNYGATCEAVEWLIQQGHTRIGFIKGPALQWSAIQRERAYRQTLRNHDIAVSNDWVAEGDYQLPSGRAAAEQLLRVNPHLTAIVAANDQMALGVLEACRQYRVRVPLEVSVVGFDNADAASLSSPTLTTIHHPMHEIGIQAAELLIEQIATGKKELQRVLLPGELIVRESTCALTGATVVSVNT